jgi:hypothetical protein
MAGQFTLDGALVEPQAHECVHHWIIEPSAIGHTANAECKKCGTPRKFGNRFHSAEADTPWRVYINPDGSERQGKASRLFDFPIGVRRA